MNLDILKDRVVIVTGASSGIGRACVLGYGAAGSKVVVTGRRIDLLEGVAEKIKAKGGDAVAIETDVTSEAEVAEMFAKTVERYGTVDILVNNAGVGGEAAIEDCSLEMWMHTINTNLTSAFICSREAFRIMKPKGRGRILNIGSISARVPRANSPAYSASKFGLEGLTRALAIDGREFNIAVSLLNPGMVATELVPREVRLARGFRDIAATPKQIADAVLHMTSLPDHLNFYEAMIIQNGLPFLGRG